MKGVLIVALNDKCTPETAARAKSELLDLLPDDVNVVVIGGCTGTTFVPDSSPTFITSNFYGTDEVTE